MSAAAVGLSPKIRPESVEVRGDASTLSRRTSFDESDDDVPGVVTCEGLLLLDGGCADGALPGCVVVLPGCVVAPPGGVVDV